MNRTSFLDELRRRLKGLPAAEIDAALAYYDEYLDDAGPEGEAEALSRLGSPAEVAASIIGQYALRDTTPSEKKAGGSLSMIWIVILGLLASPIALPLAIAVIAVIVGLLVAVLAVAASLLATAAALVVVGLVAAGAGVAVVISDFASAVFFVGAGLVCMAIGLAFGLVTCWLIKVCVRGIIGLGARLLKRKGAQQQ